MQFTVVLLATVDAATREALQQRIDAVTPIELIENSDISVGIAQEPATEPPRKLYIATYSHRHGTDTYLLYADRHPGKDDIIAFFDLDFEGDREDEYIDIDPYRHEGAEKIPVLPDQDTMKASIAAWEKDHGPLDDGDDDDDDDDACAICGKPHTECSCDVTDITLHATE